MKNYKLILSALGLLTPVLARGIDINFDTSTASIWSVNAGGAQNATPYIVPANNDLYQGNVVAITSDAINTGTFLPGGSLANFDGFWTANFTFFLPSAAANISLSYSKFFVDDRGVMLLNGNIVGSVGLAGDGNYTGTMVFTDGGTPQPYTFNSPYTGVSGSASSGFIVGGLNTLEIIVNNTGNGLAGTMNGNLAWNDGTAFGVVGTISYTLVPEPSTTALVGLAMGSLIWIRAQRARKNSF